MQQYTVLLIVINICFNNVTSFNVKNNECYRLIFVFFQRRRLEEWHSSLAEGIGELSQFVVFLSDTLIMKQQKA